MYVLEQHPSRGQQLPCPSQPEETAQKSGRQWRMKSLEEIHWLTWSTCRWNLSASCHGSTVPIVTGWPPWSNTVTPCSAGQMGGDQDITQILLVALFEVKRNVFPQTTAMMPNCFSFFSSQEHIQRVAARVSSKTDSVGLSPGSSKLDGH